MPAVPSFTACLPACKKLDSFSVFPLLKGETSRLLASKLDIMMLAALFGYGLEDEKEATAARDISFPEKVMILLLISFRFLKIIIQWKLFHQGKKSC